MFVLQLVPDLLSFVVSIALRAAFFVLGFAVVYAVGRLFFEPVMNRIVRARKLEPTLARPLRRLARVAVLFFALTFGFSAAGLGNLLSASATIAAALTLAVGLASQSLMSNVVSGAFIVADEKFQIGDWIRWGDTEGVVEDIGFRVTRVRTFDGELVTVPNSNLTASEVTNPAAADRLRVTLSFDVSREHDADEVSEMLRSEVAAIPETLSDPKPSVRATELTPDHVRLQIRFWIADPEHTDLVRVRSVVIRRVDERFAAEGVALAD
ncbi:mechanosensitive ion channel family protein [Halorussus sp. MSC15.2]|uniref:mechanosensitive ion channel family protein n=1 Tax=Halorussus sp. MSC15.2 TaxID=2283638 RepID=UPI0013D11684|nr:mechanosensitive ion channel family protein [Halorussus sp. MSC15.2]NEU58026.1 mechanosensitive ion channel family protein [Halorussus sp. MSC15.2]